MTTTAPSGAVVHSGGQAADGEDEAPWCLGDLHKEVAELLRAGEKPFYTLGFSANGAATTRRFARDATKLKQAVR